MSSKHWRWYEEGQRGVENLLEKKKLYVTLQSWVLNRRFVNGPSPDNIISHVYFAILIFHIVIGLQICVLKISYAACYSLTMERLDVFPGSRVITYNAQILYWSTILMRMPLYLDHSQMLNYCLAFFNNKMK